MRGWQFGQVYRHAAPYSARFARLFGTASLGDLSLALMLPGPQAMGVANTTVGLNQLRGFLAIRPYFFDTPRTGWLAGLLKDAVFVRRAARMGEPIRAVGLEVYLTGRWHLPAESAVPREVFKGASKGDCDRFSMRVCMRNMGLGNCNA